MKKESLLHTMFSFKEIWCLCPKSSCIFIDTLNTEITVQLSTVEKQFSC
jgi:hypothetical protein